MSAPYSEEHPESLLDELKLYASEAMALRHLIYGLHLRGDDGELSRVDLWLCRA